MGKTKQSCLEATGTSREHWLPGPHMRLVKSWTPFPTTEIDYDGRVRLCCVTPERVDAFVKYENHVRSRCVGGPLIEHLRRFGRYLAFMYFSEEGIIAIQRFRLYHEFDQEYRTLLNAYFYVDPRFRSAGLGSSMLRITRDYYKQQGRIDCLASEAWPENEPSIRAAINAGFNVHSQHPNGKVILLKQITQI